MIACVLLQYTVYHKHSKYIYKYLLYFYNCNQLMLIRRTLTDLR